MKHKTLVIILILALLIGSISISYAGTGEAEAVSVTDWGQILENNLLTTGPHGLALKSWSYLYGKTIDFIDSLRLEKELNGTAEENSATIEGHALTLARHNRETRKTQQNHVEDARNLVWVKIKNSSIYSLNQERTESYAIQHSKEIVDDYYSTIQFNLAHHQSAFVLTLKNLQNKSIEAKTEYDYPFYFKGTAKYSSWGNTHQITKKNEKLEFYKRNLTLANGSKIEVWDIEELVIPKRSYSHGKIVFDPIPYHDESAHSGDGNPVAAEIFVKALNTEDKEIYDSIEWDNLFNKINHEDNRMKDNAQEYIEEIYEQYRKGEINVSDLVDAQTLVSQLNTQINKTGYYAFSGVKLSLLGINTSLTNTFQIKLIETNESLNGMLLTDHVPRTNASFVTNTTYYPNNWSKTLYFVGDEYREIKEPFKIQEITDYRGETIQETGLETYNRQTMNTSKLEEELDQLNSLYNITVNYSSTSVGGTTPGSGTTINDFLGSLTDKTLGVPNYIIFLAIIVLGYGFVTAYGKSMGG